VQKQNIFLLCANGLHRKWRQKELGTILGKIAFGPYPLICHDAEDKENLTYFGETEMGHEVGSSYLCKCKHDEHEWWMEINMCRIRFLQKHKMAPFP
jgi:nickel-dependent lactate racemase